MTIVTRFAGLVALGLITAAACTAYVDEPSDVVDLTSDPAGHDVLADPGLDAPRESVADAPDLRADAPYLHAESDVSETDLAIGDDGAVSEEVNDAADEAPELAEPPSEVAEAIPETTDVEPSDCVPICTGRQCGDDGCGGTCGACPGDDPCRAECKDGTCGPSFTPAATDLSCDGIDDDCSGEADEDFVGTPTACGVGACQGVGTTTCENGDEGNSCTAGGPGANDSVCNGIDDDCDGQTDEDFASAGTNCGEGACERDGELICVEGTPVDTCEAGTADADDATCDEVDDDCDGTVDEDYDVTITSCGVGACVRAGQLTCSGGTETDSCSPGAPTVQDATCDAIDDDCSGAADEDYVPISSCFKPGACAAANAASTCAGGIETACATGTPAANDADCDAIDDDCSGTADEDYVPISSCFKPGACAAANVASTCAGGIETACATGTPAANDADCDAIDDDCSGAADEDYAVMATTCGLGACARAGHATCIDGVETDSCQPGQSASDVCNGLDDDCDGETDEPELGPISECDDGDPCTDDACGGGAGCIHVDNVAPCNDQNECTTSDTCADGGCAGIDTSAADCDDGNVCTVDSCDTALGCVQAIQPNRTRCGEDRVCYGGACEATCTSSAQCPAGLALFDGCHCEVVSTGISVAQCWNGTALTECSTLSPTHVLFGQDGHYPHGALLFRDMNDGTVVDTQTGLVWAQETSEALTWAEATTWCQQNSAGLPGSEWRLPTIDEAWTIFDFSRSACPWRDPEFETACPPDTYRYWTSSPVGDGTRHYFTAEAVVFYEDSADLPARARCVRGNAGIEAARYVDGRDGTILDRVTGLVWSKAPDCVGCTWAEAAQACKEKGAWRLPTIKELSSSLHYGSSATFKLDPMFETTGMTGSLARQWSSTPWVGTAGKFMFANMASARTAAEIVDQEFSVRCVAIERIGTARPSPEVLLNSTTVYSQIASWRGHALAALSTGGYAAAWYGSQDGSGWGAVARRFQADGSPIDDEVLVNAWTPGDQVDVAIAGLVSGGFVVTWHDGGQGTLIPDGHDGSFAGIFARRFDGDGLPLDSEDVPVNTYTAFEQTDPMVVGLPSGGYLIVWTSGCGYPLEAGCTGEDGSNMGVFARAFKADGSAAEAPFRVNENTGADQLGGMAAVLSDGRVGFVWSSWNSAHVDTWQVYQRFFDGTTLAPLTGEVRVSQDLTRTVESPTIARVGTGYVIGWTYYTKDFSSADAVARAYDAAGKPTGPEITLSRHHQDFQWEVSVTGTSDSGWLATWTSGCDPRAADLFSCGSSAPDGSAQGIFAQRFDALGQRDGPEHRVNAYVSSVQNSPSVKALNDGTNVVVWNSLQQLGASSGWDVFSRGFEDACHDSVDNDGDGQADCFDPDCAGRTCVDDGLACTRDVCDPVDGCVHTPGVEALNGKDDDCDGATDEDLDVDGDGISKDGDLSAVSGDAPCTGGQSVLCDDNCPQVSNGAQGDSDGDGVGDACDATVCDDANAVADDGCDGTVPKEFRVNAYTTDAQTTPAVVAFPDGGFGIAWTSDGQDGSGDGVYLRRFDGKGSPRGLEALVGSYTTGNQRNPSITALADGRFAVAWQDAARDGDESGTFFQRFGADGNAVVGDVAMNALKTGGQVDARVVALSDARIVGAWTHYGSAPEWQDPYGQLFAWDGSTVGAAFPFNTYTTESQGPVAIAALPDGGFLSVWDSDGQDGSQAGVFAQRFSSEPTKVGPEFRVNTYTAGGQSESAVAAWADGSFVIVWNSYAQVNSTSEIYAQRFNADGTTKGQEYRLNSTIVGDQQDPDVAALADGGFVATWASAGQDGHSWGVFLQRFDAAGQMVGGEIPCNVLDTMNAQASARVVVLADGSWLVVWWSQTNNEIFGQRFWADGVRRYR